MSSLCLMGFLLGLMLGRLFETDRQPPQLLDIQTAKDGLLLTLDEQPEVRSGQLEGALALQIEARGDARQGHLQLGKAPVRWRLQPQAKYLQLTLLSIQPLQGRWEVTEVKDRWQLKISLSLGSKSQ